MRAAGGLAFRPIGSAMSHRFSVSAPRGSPSRFPLAGRGDGRVVEPMGAREETRGVSQPEGRRRAALASPPIGCAGQDERRSAWPMGGGAWRLTAAAMAEVRGAGSGPGAALPVPMALPAAPGAAPTLPSPAAGGGGGGGQGAAPGPATAAGSGGAAREGWLFKWTNYIKGYQRRWFVLSNGLLSYYRYGAPPRPSPPRPARSVGAGAALPAAGPTRRPRAALCFPLRFPVFSAAPSVSLGVPGTLPYSLVPAQCPPLA